MSYFLRIIMYLFGQYRACGVGGVVAMFNPGSPRPRRWMSVLGVDVSKVLERVRSVRATTEKRSFRGLLVGVSRQAEALSDRGRQTYCACSETTIVPCLSGRIS
jgi:hypothetical protein